MRQVDTATVVGGMEKVDFVLPGHDPETITALAFSLVERGTNAGLTLGQIVKQVEMAHGARAMARN